MKRSPILLLALALTACGAPQMAPGPNVPGNLPAAPAAAQTSVSLTPDSAAIQAPAVTSFGLQVAGPVGLMNATASSTQPRSSAASAIDGNANTRWLSNFTAVSPTLTVELNNPTALKLLTLTLNTDAFPRGTTYDVQVATTAAGPYTTALARQTKPTRGSVTLTMPSTTPDAKFVRIKCNNVLTGFSRATFGIAEMSATADFAPPPPPPPPPPPAGGGGGTGGTPTGVTGAFSFLTNFPSFVQYRPGVGRLRFELVGTPGAPETAALNALETEATASTPAFQFPAHGKMVKADGTVLGDFNALMATVPGEPGVVLGADVVTGNLVELIWPLTATGIPGDAIVRVQLQNAPAGLDGQTITTSFSFGKVDGTGTVASWTGSANAVVPAAR